MGKQADPVHETSKRRAPGSTRVAGPQSRVARSREHREYLTYLRIVEQVTCTGISQRELGEAVGATVRTVQNWASGQSVPRGISRERLLDVHYVIEGLREIYSDEGIEIWLRARNRNLGGARPIAMLTAGGLEPVLEEVQRMAGSM